MSDLSTLLFKIGLPGIPLTLLLLYVITPNDIAGQESVVIIGIFFSLAVGYIIQQLWFMVFECTGLKYNGKNRPVLRKIEYILQADETLLRRWHPQSNAENLDANELYAIWEAMLYAGRIDKSASDKLKAFWNYYHSNMAIAIGIFLATIGFLVYSMCNNLVFSDFLHKNWLLLLLSVVIIAILVTKAFQTKAIVDRLEENWAEKWICQVGSSFIPVLDDQKTDKRNGKKKSQKSIPEDNTQKSRQTNGRKGSK